MPIMQSNPAVTLRGSTGRSCYIYPLCYILIIEGKEMKMIYTLTHCKNEEERSQAIESFKDMVYQQCLSRMYEGRTYERKFTDSVNDIKINFSNAVDLICWYDKEQKLQDAIEASLCDKSKENDLKLCICEIVTDCIVNDEVDGLISNDDY